MATMRQYKAGEVIFSENDVEETTYIIEQGRVEVLKCCMGKTSISPILALENLLAKWE